MTVVVSNYLCYLLFSFGECTFTLIFSLVRVHLGVFDDAFILKVLGSLRAQGESTCMDMQTQVPWEREVTKGCGFVLLLVMVINPIKLYFCLENRLWTIDC